MKFEIKNLKKVALTVALFSLSPLAAKNLSECIKGATCKASLIKNLEAHGHKEVVTVFKNAKTAADAKKALAKLGVTLRLQVMKAAAAHKAHLTKILV